MNRQTAYALRSGLVEPQFFGCDSEDPKVSAVSRFDDEVWDFTNEDENPARSHTDTRICWSFRTPQGVLFTSPRFKSLLTGLKQFIYALRWHPIDSAPLAVSALICTFRRAQRFVHHLLAYPTPVLRFKDVLPHHCEDYIEEVLSCGLSASYKYHCLNILAKLFFYRRVMKDGLVIEPLKGESAHRMAGYTRASQLESQTQIIPDDILTPLVRAALEYVDRFADYLLDACECIEGIRERHRWFGVWARRYVHKHASAAYGLDGSKFENGLRSLRHLNKELCYLQTACFVLIAFMTGMRLSELLSLREGCCETEAEPGQVDLVWLRSRVFKMQGVPKGRSARWLGGPICARAVRVLERLGKRVRLRVGIGSLWVPVPAAKRPRPKKPFQARTIRVRLKHFVRMLGLKDSSGRAFHIHPHMFRRTFARHVVRYDTTNLLALKEHFKHISLSMTDYYVGSDLELWTLMMEEEEKLLFESFDKALRADRMAGPGGVRLKRTIDEAIAEGRLPREFRGEAGDHLRKEMIRNLVESGQRVYPCAASNYCWFRPESALCTQGNHPLLKRCNPGACTNSIITLEHKPHWEKVQRDCEDLMQLKPQAEPYQKALRDIQAVSSKILRDLK
jgi:integrase